jgi:pentatricopeptide repeat protein
LHELAQLLDEMKAAGLTPTKNAYLAALNALGESGRVGPAHALYKEMQAAGVEIDEFGYAALINSYKHSDPVCSPVMVVARHFMPRLHGSITDFNGARRPAGAG